MSMVKCVKCGFQYDDNVFYASCPKCGATEKPLKKLRCSVRGCEVALDDGSVRYIGILPYCSTHYDQAMGNAPVRAGHPAPDKDQKPTAGASPPDLSPRPEFGVLGAPKHASAPYRTVLIIGLVVALGQLLVPPQHITGSTVHGYRFVVTRYLPIWSQPEDIVFLRDDEGNKYETGGRLIFTDSHGILASRLAVQLAITGVLTAMGLILLPRSST